MELADQEALEFLMDLVQGDYREIVIDWLRHEATLDVSVDEAVEYLRKFERGVKVIERLSGIEFPAQDFIGFGPEELRKELQEKQREE